jgi:hypothetical protein
MGDSAGRENGSRDGERSLSVVGRFAYAPFVLRVSDVPGNDRTWWAFEPSYSVWVVTPHGLVRERLRLLADGIADSDSSEAADYTVEWGGAHVRPIARSRRANACKRAINICDGQRPRMKIESQKQVVAGRNGDLPTAALIEPAVGSDHRATS